MTCITDKFHSMGVQGILTIQSLTIIFENSRTGEIPEDWKKASVVLIFHKGKEKKEYKVTIL